jgi:hypothetical protein
VIGPPLPSVPGEKSARPLGACRGLLGLGMGFETVAEVPRLLVTVRVVPGKEFKHAVPSHEIVVITFAWQPAWVCWGFLRLLFGMALSLHAVYTP